MIISTWNFVSCVPSAHLFRSLTAYLLTSIASLLLPHMQSQLSLRSHIHLYILMTYERRLGPVLLRWEASSKTKSERENNIESAREQCHATLLFPCDSRPRLRLGYLYYELRPVCSTSPFLGGRRFRPTCDSTFSDGSALKHPSHLKSTQAY